MSPNFPGTWIWDQLKHSPSKEPVHYSGVRNTYCWLMIVLAVSSANGSDTGFDSTTYVHCVLFTLCRVTARGEKASYLRVYVLHKNIFCFL
jgi:hypothetical protein